MKVNKYDEVLDWINTSIGNTDNFQMNDLKMAYQIYNATTEYLYKKYVTRKQALDILNKIDDIIKTKLLRLEPTLSLEVLEKICLSYKNSILGVPTDITVIDDKAVFCLGTIPGESTAIDGSEIFHISGYTENDYKEINNNDESFTQNVWDKNFNSDLAFGRNPVFNYFDSEKTEQLVKKMVDYINKMLSPIFLSSIMFAGSDFNNSDYYYGGDTIFYVSESVKIFSSLNLPQLMDAIYSGNNISFRIIAVNDWNEFFGFDIRQTVHDDKSFTWEWEFYVPKVWNLERSVYKYKNNVVNSNSLVRKKALKY